MLSPRNPLARVTLTVILIAAMVTLLALVILADEHDRVEVEDIAYIMAIGLDRTDSGLIELTCQIAVPAHGSGGEGGSGGSMPVMIVTVRGATMMDALRSLSQTSSKAPFWGQARVVVFGEQLAREGLAPVLDILTRNYETRRQMWVLATPGRARDVLGIKPQMENLPALLLSGLETEANYHSLAPQTTLHDLIVSTASTAEEPRVAAIKIRPTTEPVKQGSAENSSQSSGTMNQELYLDGCAVFRLDKLVGWLSGMESRGLSWMRGDASAGIISFNDAATGMQGSVEVLRSSSIMTAEVDPNNIGASQFTIRISGEGRLTEYYAGPNVTLSDTAKKIDDIIGSHMQYEAQQALTRLQADFKTDALGLGELVREQISNAAWDAVRDDWANIFLSVKVNIMVDFKLRRHGMTLDRLVPDTER